MKFYLYILVTGWNKTSLIVFYSISFMFLLIVLIDWLSLVNCNNFK